MPFQFLFEFEVINDLKAIINFLNFFENQLFHLGGLFLHVLSTVQKEKK